VVFSQPSEAADFNGRFRKVGVVVQSPRISTTYGRSFFELVPKCQEMKFINTICKPTTDHQEEIRLMPLENDVMIIVGSFTSANTKRLTEISRDLNPRTYQVQSADDIQGEWLAGARNIGISAGASTPIESSIQWSNASVRSSRIPHEILSLIRQFLAIWQSDSPSCYRESSRRQSGMRFTMIQDIMWPTSDSAKKGLKSNH